MAPAALQESDPSSPPRRATRSQSKAKSSQEESLENFDEAKTTKVVRKTRKRKSPDEIPSDTSKKSQKKSHKPVAKEKPETPKPRTRKGTTSKNPQSKSPEQLEDAKTTKVARKPMQRKSLKIVQREKSFEKVEDQASSAKRPTRACRTRIETRSEHKESSRSIRAISSNDEKSSELVKEDTSLEQEKTKAPKQKTIRKKKADKIPNSTPQKIGKESSEQTEPKKNSNDKQTSKLFEDSKNSIDEIIEDSHTDSTTNNNNISNNNNNYLSINTNKQDKLWDSMCEGAEEAAAKQSETGYTLDDLQQFLLNSSIKEMFSFQLEHKTTMEIFQRLNGVIYNLETVQLDQLLDLYHLAIIMQRFQPLETGVMSERHELLDAVGELSIALQPKDIEYIGISLCDRFVIGCGNQRMQHLINMVQAIVMLINSSLQNSKIAMLTLLATFAKVSGLNMPDQYLDTDIIKNAFEMAKLVNWAQLVETNRLPDMFVLVRCFALIINAERNRRIYPNWHKELGIEIHNFFMIVLSTVRSCKNYNFFAMAIERYIAFCVVRGAAPRPYTTDAL